MQERVDLPTTKPILRLARREDFERVSGDLRAEILKALNVDSWDENNFDIHIIGEDEKYQAHYIKRVSSINNGIAFLLDLPCYRSLASLAPKNKESLKATLNGIAQHCMSHLRNLNSTEIAHYQNSLAHFTEFAVTALRIKLGITKHAATEILDRAEQFALLSQTRPAICTISNLFNSENDFAVQIDTPLNPFSDEIKAELNAIEQNARELPIWYSALSNEEKLLLQHFLNTHVIADFGTSINAVSSKLRLLPVPSNYGKHTLITRIYSDFINPILTVHSPEIRSSHIASRDVPRKNTGTRTLHAINNLLVEIEEAIQFIINKMSMDGANYSHQIVVPILYQTLISPIKDPDTSLDKDRLLALSAIEHYLHTRKRKDGEPNIHFLLLTTNHPLNYARHLAPLLSSETNESISNMLFFAKNNARGTTIEQKLKSLACDKLQKYCDEWTTFLDPYRELYISTLEQLIVGAQGGISIGSCVSGKDRKAVEIAHTDAMRIYYVKYGYLPPLYADKNNQNDLLAMQSFAEIFAEIYCTKHQPALAEQNAPGSFGTKTPGMYLPPHLQNAIKAWYTKHAALPNRDDHHIYAVTAEKDTLKESDILATNNDLENIKYRSLPTEQDDYSWKVSLAHIHELNPIEHLINAAIMSFADYHKDRADNLGFFSSMGGSIYGELRAKCYKEILSSKQLDTLTRTIVLYALLTTASGKTLKASVSKAMGLSDPELTVTTLKNYIIFANRTSEEGFSEIQKLVADIKAKINELNTHTDIEPCAAGIIESLKKKFVIEPFYASPSRPQSPSDHT